MVGGEVSAPSATARVLPSFYAACGTPVCSECGAKMAYSHTEIRTFHADVGDPVCPACGAKMAYSHTEIRRRVPPAAPQTRKKA